MSRIGKKPILIPAGVQVQVQGQKVSVKGPKGEISREFPAEVKIALEGDKLLVSGQPRQPLWGTVRAILFGMVKGVLEGYEKRLEIEGVGFKASVEGNFLVLNVGFSHQIKLPTPEGIKFSVEKNVIVVSGVNKELVGQTAATVRGIKPPEPYKGKGIRHQGEQIRRKLGKKAVATTAK